MLLRLGRKGCKTHELSSFLRDSCAPIKSQAFLPHIYLIWVKLCLGETCSETMYPHLDSAHRFLGLLSEMTFLTAHSSVPPTPLFSHPGNWQLLTRKEDWVFALGEDGPPYFHPVQEAYLFGVYPPSF